MTGSTPLAGRGELFPEAVDRSNPGSSKSVLAACHLDAEDDGRRLAALFCE